jgi:DNA-binding MarR family transcriptional regulator
MDSEKLIAAKISTVRSCINQFLTQELKRNGLKGLAPSHGAIFFHLFDNVQMTMKELAKAIRRDKSTITALVSKLVEKGYVQKGASQDDLRTMQVSLTEKGNAFRPIFEDISNRLNQRIWAGIGSDDQKAIMRILRQIEANF